MLALTRRRYPERQDCWHVYYGDVHAGTIARRTGQPHDEDPWEWRCGFYPGCNPGEHTNGTAETFDQARADFEAAWMVFLSKRTEADFQEYRRQRALTAWKYKMWDTGCRMPTQETSGRSRCFCGETITLQNDFDHVYRTHMGIAGSWKRVTRPMLMSAAANFEARATVACQKLCPLVELCLGGCRA
jgi:hypothetical protein